MTILKNVTAGIRRSMVYFVVSVLIVVPLGIVCVFIPLFLVLRSDLSIWYLIIPATLFFFILNGGGMAFVVLTLVRRARKLDEVFTPLGLEGKRYQLTGRQYHGKVREREVEVYFYRGPIMDIGIPTPLQTRLGITHGQVDTKFLGSLLNKQPLSFADPAMEDLLLYPADDDWTRALCESPEVPGLLKRLTKATDTFFRHNVMFSPGWVRLMLSGSGSLFEPKVMADEVRQWIYDLITLIEVAESRPEPTVAVEVSGAEKMLRSMRKSSTRRVEVIAAVVVLGVIVCSVGAGVIATLIAMSTGS